MTSTTRLLFGKRIIAVGVTVSEREAGVGAGAGVGVGVGAGAGVAVGTGLGVGVTGEEPPHETTRRPPRTINAICRITPLVYRP